MAMAMAECVGDETYYFEDLSVGMEASYAKKITNEDILAFAELSGDVNPIHLSDEFAASTIFKKRIAHGFFYREPDGQVRRLGGWPADDGQPLPVTRGSHVYAGGRR